MTETPQRSNLITLGRVWGTCASSDEIDNLCWLFYDVDLVPFFSIGTRNPSLPTFDLLINYDLGTCDLQDTDGNTLHHYDLGELLPQLEKAPS